MPVVIERAGGEQEELTEVPTDRTFIFREPELELEHYEVELMDKLITERGRFGRVSRKGRWIITYLENEGATNVWKLYREYLRFLIVANQDYEVDWGLINYKLFWKRMWALKHEKIQAIRPLTRKEVEERGLELETEVETGEFEGKEKTYYVIDQDYDLDDDEIVNPFKVLYE